MRCCGRIESLCLSLILLLAFGAAQAADIDARGAQLAMSEEGYSLSADFTIKLSPRLDEAVRRGIVLHFAADFELTRERWYWLDQQIVKRSRRYQLSYHALTRQYRLSMGALHQNFESLGEALQVLSRLRSWQVIARGEVSDDAIYVAALRLRLDLTQMPKTFQVSALSNRDWNLSSDWLRWEFTPTEAARPPDGSIEVSEAQ